MDDANSFFFPTSEHSSCYELPSVHSIPSSNSDKDLPVEEPGSSSDGSSFLVDNVSITCPEEEGGRQSGGSTSSDDSVNDAIDGSSSGNTSAPSASTSTGPQCDLLMFLNVASNSIMRTLEKPRRLAGLKKRKVNHRRFIEKQLHKKHLAYPQFHAKVRSVRTKEYKQMRTSHPNSCPTPPSTIPCINPAVLNNNFTDHSSPFRQTEQQWDCFQNDNLFSGSQVHDPAQFWDPLDTEVSFQSDSFELSDEAIDDLMRLCDMVSANSDDMLQQPRDYTSFDSFAADSSSSSDSLSDLSMFFDSPFGTTTSNGFCGLGSDCPSFNATTPSEMSAVLEQTNGHIVQTSPTTVYDQASHDYDGQSYQMLEGDGYRQFAACMYDQRREDDLDKMSIRDNKSQQEVEQVITPLSLEDVGLPFLF